MCDYSLHGLKNRLANEGERLRVYRFHTGSKGLAPINEVPQLAERNGSWWQQLKAFLVGDGVPSKSREEVCAVCIPPGAQMEVEGLSSYLQWELGVNDHERVTFVQLSVDAFRYRDAIRFANGREVLLQRLNDGLQMTVKRLSLDEESIPQQAMPRAVTRQQERRVEAYVA